MENEQVEQVQWEVQPPSGAKPSEEMGSAGPGLLGKPKRELLSSIGLFKGKGLLGFWFGVGATLGAKVVNSLEELISIK